MERKNIIISIILILCLMGAVNYLFLPKNTFYDTIELNEVKMKVPSTNNNTTMNLSHYTEYNDTENGVNIYVFDSEGTTLNDAGQLFKFLSNRDINQLQAIQYNKDNLTYNYSSSLNEYTYLKNFKHKNIFVIAKNEEDMQHIIKSLSIYEKKNNITANKSNNTEEKIVEKVVTYHPNFE